MLKREGGEVGKKRAYRLYRLDGLQLRMKVKRRERTRCCEESPSRRLSRISMGMDFVHDQWPIAGPSEFIVIQSMESRESVSGG